MFTTKTLDLTKSIKISFELLLLILQPPSSDVIILVRGNIIKPQIQLMVMLLQRKVTHDDGEKRRRCDFKFFFLERIYIFHYVNEYVTLMTRIM